MISGQIVSRADASSPLSDGAEGALASLIRQALLRFAQAKSPAQDGLDCADLLAVAGHADVADALREIIAVETGVPAGNAFAGLADGEGQSKTGFTGDGPGASALETLVAQLRSVQTAADDIIPLPPTGPEIAASFAADGVDAGRSGEPGPVPDPVTLRSLCAALRSLLGRAPSPQARGELSSVLLRLRAVLAPVRLDGNRHVGAPLPVLGAWLAAERLRRCLTRMADLTDAPFGSPACFHAAAGLGRAGLGPLFLNAAHVMRGPRDVLALVQLAAGLPGGGVDEETLERWSFLLSVHLPDSALRALVDELTDEGLMRAVWGILERTARRPETDISVLWSIRDAGLDTGDLALAVRAQRLVIARSVHKANEWILLGRLEATAGHHSEAEDAFLHGLELDPHDTGGRDNLHALRRGAFEDIEVRSGFGTPPHRKLVRQKQRRR